MLSKSFIDELLDDRGHVIGFLYDKVLFFRYIGVSRMSYCGGGIGLWLDLSASIKLNSDK